MQQALNILVIDSHPLYARGLETCLQQMQWQGQLLACAQPDELPEVLRSLQPQLVFMELNLQHRRHDGFSLCCELKQRYPALFVAVLTAYSQPAFIERARSCGANAYLHKGSEPDMLCNFLKLFLQNQLPPYYILTPQKPTAEKFSPDAFELKQQLTKRERQLLSLIATGKQNGEICFLLDIEYETLRYHRNNLYRKMGVENDAQLTRLVIDSNLPLDPMRLLPPPV